MSIVTKMPGRFVRLRAIFFSVSATRKGFFSVVDVALIRLHNVLDKKVRVTDRSCRVIDRVQGGSDRIREPSAGNVVNCELPRLNVFAFSKGDGSMSVLLGLFLAIFGGDVWPGFLGAGAQVKGTGTLPLK